MVNYWYIVIERSHRMAVLATGLGTEQDGWDLANTMATTYPDLIADYDVLFFQTKREMLEFILKQRGV